MILFKCSTIVSQESWLYGGSWLVAEPMSSLQLVLPLQLEIIVKRWQQMKEYYCGNYQTGSVTYGEALKKGDCETAIVIVK